MHRDHQIHTDRVLRRWLATGVVHLALTAVGLAMVAADATSSAVTLGTQLGGIGLIGAVVSAMFATVRASNVEGELRERELYQLGRRNR